MTEKIFYQLASHYAIKIMTPETIIDRSANNKSV